MKYEASSVDDYIAQLPEERRAIINKLREIIKQNLPMGFEETLSYNMIGFVVPHSTYAAGYHCNPELPLPFINLASQKNFIALYHLGIYAKKELLDWFVEAYPKHAKYKLDMGKSCIRFKKMNDIPFSLIEALVKKMSVTDWVSAYEDIILKKKKE